MIETRIALPGWTRHKAFALFDKLPSGEKFLAYRDGDRHGNGPATIKYVKESDWGNVLYEFSRPGYDPRGACGGVTSVGTILFYVRTYKLSGTGPQHELWCCRSTDGVTFTETLLYSSNTDLIAVHGKIIEHNGKIIQGAFRNPAVAFMLLTSTDDGASHSLTVAKDSFPSGTVFTEPTLAHIGNGNIACVARDNSAADTKALFCIGTFAGSWSTVIRIPNITMGQNPPILWFSEATNICTLIWPSRKAAYMPAGGVDHIWPWYYSCIDADVLLAELLAPKNWHNPTALPIFSPFEGDSGYPNILDDGDDVLMTYHKGNYVPGQGTEMFIAKISDILGGFV